VHSADVLRVIAASHPAVAKEGGNLISEAYRSMIDILSPIMNRNWLLGRYSTQDCCTMKTADIVP